MQVKKISEILGRLIDVTMIHTSELTDFTPGSIIRSIYDAVAEEVESFYMLTRENISWGIAEGVTDTFGFSRRQAIAAYGDVVVTFYSTTTRDYTFPQGTAFYSSVSGYNQTYSLPAPVVVPAGASQVTLRVYCDTLGAIGNIPAGFINRIKSNLTNLGGVTNPQAFLTGQDEESIVALRNRFQSFIVANGRSTVKAIDYGARTVKNVSGVYVSEVPGMITVYAHDLNGNLSDALQASILKTLEGDGTNNQGNLDDYKPAGVPIRVLPIEKTVVDLDLDLTVSDIDFATDAFVDTVEAKIANYINQFQAGDSLVMSSLIKLVMGIDESIIKDVVITRPISSDLSDKQAANKENINTATTELQNANTIVTEAEKNNITTMATLLQTGADYVITPQDKLYLNNILKQINTNYNTDLAAIRKYVIESYAYAAAYNQVTTYLATLTADPNSQTEIDYTTYQTTLSEYYNARVNLAYSIQQAASDVLNDYKAEKLSLQSEIDTYTKSNIIVEPSQLLRSGTIDIYLEDYDS